MGRKKNSNVDSDLTAVGLRKLIKKDSHYEKYLNIVEHCRSLANFDNLVTEMEGMHASRRSRQLYTKREYSVKKLLECVAQDASYRSRCVEIMIRVNKELRRLNVSSDAVKSHLYARYKAELAFLYSTKIDREHFIRAMITDSTEILSDFEHITEIAKYVIDDIDKFGWSVKHLIDGLTILYKKDHAT